MNKNTAKFLNRLKELPFKDNIQLTLFKQKTKNPFKEDWINDPEQKYSIETAELELLRKPDQNIGLMHNKHFIVIDIDSDLNDDNILYLAVKEMFKPTFMTKTAKGCHAIYYSRNDLPQIHQELKKGGAVYGEYRHNNHHVVEAGSIHPSGIEYEVMQDLPINEFDMKDFDNLMSLFDIKLNKKKLVEKNQKTLFTPLNKKLSLEQVADLINATPDKFNLRKDNSNTEYYFWKGVLPNHQSEGGKHATVKFYPESNHVAWNCFQHAGDESKRNYKTLKAMVEGICNCEDTSTAGEEVLKEININEATEDLSDLDEDKLMIDRIIKDPIHDILTKFKTYKYIENNRSKGVKKDYSEYQKFSYHIIDYLTKNDSSIITAEVIKYAIKSHLEDFYVDKKTNNKQSYYSIINDFIFNTDFNNYYNFITAFNNAITLQTIDFDVISSFFETSPFKDYVFSLNKWVQSSKQDFKPYSVEELITGEFKQNFLIENFIVDDGISLISADKGAGKTFLAMHLLLSVATGMDFMGLKTIKSNVYYLDLENGEKVIAPRLKGLIKGFDLSSEEAADLFKNTHFNIKHSGWGFISRENNELKVNHGNLNEVLTECVKNNVKLMVIDPLVNIGQIQESNEEYTFLKNMVFDRFLEHGIAIIILHHLTKGSDKNGNKSARGGGALEGFVVTSYNLKILETDNKGNAKKLELYRVKGRNGEINNITYDIDITEKVNTDNTKEYDAIKLTKIERLNGLLPEQKSVLDTMETQEYYTTEEFKALLQENNLIKENVINWTASKEVRLILSYVDKVKWKDHKIRDGTVPTRGDIYVLKKPKLIGDDEE